MAKLHEGVVGITKSDVSLADFSVILKQVNDKMHVISSAQVGPTIADDLKTKLIICRIVCTSNRYLLVYTLMRFSKWQFSAGAISRISS
jgi:preprotein translocase subunit SecF